MHVSVAALWGRRLTREEKPLSCCVWLECSPPAEEADPAPHAYKPLCSEASQSHQVWTAMKKRDDDFDPCHCWTKWIRADCCSLTSMLFHKSNNTFFIGKWGACPLQNLVTIPKSMTEMGSLLNRGEPTLEKQAEVLFLSCFVESDNNSD